jgi:CubicO group peptidase (beta-lactamase class C family)
VEWERVRGPALEEYGWSEDGLQRVFAFLRDSANSTGVVVVDRGRVVFQFGDVEDLSYLASVRKSVLSILYGRYVEDGTIDLEASLASLGVDDVGGLLPIEREATIHHLITARSGVYHPASNGGDNLADAPPRGSQTPGRYMLYNNWDFNASGAVFEQLTGRNIYDELESQLAVPLQFQDWDRAAQRKSGNLSISRNPAYHMWLSTRDMARIGEMNPVYRRDGYFGYGYMWWVWDGPRAEGPFEGAYTARGAWGQWITVLPALDMVVAHKTNSVYSRTTSWESWERMLELLLEAQGVEMTTPYPWS